MLHVEDIIQFGIPRKKYLNVTPELKTAQCNYKQKIKKEVRCATYSIYWRN